MSDNPEALLRAIECIRALADQQAMPDDFWKAEVSALEAALAQQAATPSDNTEALTHGIDACDEAFVREAEYWLAPSRTVDPLVRKAEADAAIAAARQAATPAPAEPNACVVRFLGVDPLNPFDNAVLPAIPDSWRFGFHSPGDGSGMTFGFADEGPYVAYEAVRPLLAAAPATPAPAEPKRWIPVTERRPDYDETAKVLAWTRDDDYGGVKFHHIPALDFYEVDPDGDGEPGTDLARTVTHWMPEPWPPNDERAAAPATSAAQPAGLPVEQEPKYTVSGSAIVNRASGEAIPADEPVFIFRARDVHAVRALVAYSIALSPGPHRYAVEQRITDFARFKAGHPDRMKEPDTAPATSAAQPADEREAFQAWWLAHGIETTERESFQEMCRLAWQARAALEGR